MQDFSKPWTDEELYVKYSISEDEIAFINSMIRPMEIQGSLWDE
jgi:site-specific DNA-methyltransferase (adenine-specific)